MEEGGGSVVRANRYEIDMCSGKLLPKILAFALPLMCSSVLQLLFNAADIVVVGKFAGDNSLAAVGSNAALINLLVNLFVGLSVGTNILAARFIGAGNQDSLRQTVHTSMLLALLSGIVLTVVGVTAAKPLLHLMQVPDAILPLAALYLRLYFLGMPAAMLYNFGAALLRSVGDTRRPLYYLTAAGFVNVGLNLLLVIVFRLDVAGVAIATVISQYLSALLVVRCLMREEGGIRLVLRQLRIVPARLRQILEIGVPSGVQGVAFSLSNVIIQAAINGFGETVISGNTAAGNIEGFIYVACNALCQANTAFTSQNYGAGNYGRLRPIALCSAACSASVAAVGGILGYVFGPQLLHIYSNSDAVVAAGMVRVTIMFLPYVLCGLMDVIVGSIRGIGYSVTPMIVTLLGACAFRVLWIATVFQVPRFHTPEVVYWSYPISWALTFLAHLVCYLFMLRRLYRREGLLRKHHHLTHPQEE